MIENTIKVKNRETDKVYDCFPQIIDINNDGKYTLRYNVGINGYNEWINICCIYDNDKFNASYEVVKWSKAKHEYIPEEEMRTMCDNAGFRERYAIMHGERETKNINGHKCYVFTYSEDDEYQDANGATYDTVTKSWIN